ncbi:hypothetical protein PDIDSM_5799 [Penicillium digitatum]|nr:hypothetical protein PDIDSM_5799 [Penicillium digitatum]
MASNEYYHTNIPQPPGYDHTVPPKTDQAPHTVPGFGYASHSYNHGNPSAPYNGRESQQSFASDNEQYQTAGRSTEGDNYAENIPLKTNAQYGNNPDWMRQQTQYPLSPGGLEESQQRGVRKKKGFFSKKIAWVTYILTLAQIIVFILELVKNAQMTGSVIETKPTFNPMIGPSPYVQIYMGARYNPCMKNIKGIQDANHTIPWLCPNATSTMVTGTGCTLSDVCGFSGVPNPHIGGSTDDQPSPNQWYRFIIPIFMHGGFIHIGFNLWVQVTMAADMERMVGMWRYTVTYFASGIWFVLGGNYAAQLNPSDGCSGALFGILHTFLLDLLYDWPSANLRLDNFSHIGGFIMGLAIGLTIMRSPNALRERIGLARQPYVAMSGGAGQVGPEQKTTSVTDFFKGKRGLTSNSTETPGSTKGPLYFFKGRKPLWWLWWVVRAGALVAVLVGFIMLIVNFYKYPSSDCSWCYRLSCMPVNGWCNQNNLP